MIKVSNQYINEAIDSLFSLVGIKEYISYELLYKHLKKGEIKKCIKTIADYLGLPVKINLFYVSSSYHSSDAQEHRFTSTQLVKTDATGKGIEGITAQVSIPSYLPPFGTSSFVDFPIDVKVSENVTNYPDTFITLMAHELSHILLHSLLYKEKDNEVYTDITPILLGFKKIAKKGRKTMHEESMMTGINTTTVTTTTTTYGYLSDEQFVRICRKIGKILKKNKNIKKRLNKKVKFFQKRLTLFKKNILKFKEYIKVLDKNLRKKISQKDAQRIVLLHQPTYIEEVKNFIKENEKKLQKYQDYKFIKHYYQDWYPDLEKDLILSISNVEKNIEVFQKDLNIFEKNINFIDRIKVSFKSFLKTI